MPILSFRASALIAVLALSANSITRHFPADYASGYHSSDVVGGGETAIGEGRTSGAKAPFCDGCNRLALLRTSGTDPAGITIASVITGGHDGQCLNPAQGCDAVSCKWIGTLSVHYTGSGSGHVEIFRGNVEVKDQSFTGPDTVQWLHNGQSGDLSQLERACATEVDITIHITINGNTTVITYKAKCDGTC